MGLADLFEFRVKEEGEEIFPVGMTEEEFTKKARLPILKLREFCRKIGGKFVARNISYATCYLPEGGIVAGARVARTEDQEIIADVLFVNTEKDEKEYFELSPKERAVVKIYSKALKGAEFARITSSGGEIRGMIKAKSISVRTDPRGKHIGIEID